MLNCIFVYLILTVGIYSSIIFPSSLSLFSLFLIFCFFKNKVESEVVGLRLTKCVCNYY